MATNSRKEFLPAEISAIAASQLCALIKQKYGQPNCFLGSFLKSRVRQPPQFLRRQAERQAEWPWFQETRTKRAEQSDLK